MKQPVRVSVTGAAGAISYTILFKIAAGELLGKDQPVILQLVEIPPAMTALNGVVMELIDCAFPLMAAQWCDAGNPINFHWHFLLLIQPTPFL